MNALDAWIVFFCVATWFFLLGWTVGAKVEARNWRPLFDRLEALLKKRIERDDPDWWKDT